MIIDELSFPSANGRDEVAGWIYTPEEPPRAVLQLIHGYGEHSRRYMPLIEAVAKAGYAVIADDHVGHGATAVRSGHWLDTGGSKGYQTYVDDELKLTDIARERFPDLPLVLFGHSWGSMIAREQVAQRPEGIRGMILSGVVMQLTNAGLDLEVIGQSAKAAIAVNVPSQMNSNPEEVLTELSEVITAKATARYDEDDPLSWVATDPADRRAYSEDPMAAVNRKPSFDFFKDLLGIYIRVGADRYAKRVPTDLPVLILSGDLDPMGNYGEGAYHLANLLWKEGNTQVRTRVFTGARHEVHREALSADAVEEEVLAFMSRVAEQWQDEPSGHR